MQRQYRPLRLRLDEGGPARPQVLGAGQIAVGVSVLDFVIAVFHVPQRVQFFGKTAQPPSDSRLRSAKEQGNEGSMGRNVCERAGPGQCECDHSKSKEKAPLHSITSSARSRINSLSVSPRV